MRFTLVPLANFLKQRQEQWGMSSTTFQLKVYQLLEIVLFYSIEGKSGFLLIQPVREHTPSAKLSNSVK